MSEPVFDVTYRVGMRDLNAFFGVWWKRTRFDKTTVKRFAVYGLAITIMHIIALRSFITQPTFHNLAWDLALMAAMGVAALLLSAIYAFIIAFLLSPLIIYLAQLVIFIIGPARQRTIHLEVDTAGVEKTAGAIESQARWRDFSAVDATKETVLLFTGRNSATIVPKSAFATPAEAEAFAAFAQAQWREARSVF